MLDKSQTFQRYMELQINVAGSEIIIINRKKKYYVIIGNIHILMPFPLHNRISKRDQHQQMLITPKQPQSFNRY